jgi:hypothetical protein
MGNTVTQTDPTTSWTKRTINTVSVLALIGCIVWTIYHFKK